MIATNQAARRIKRAGKGGVDGIFSSGRCFGCDLENRDV